ncbi:MAG: methionyl-tRNA formyltransferase, partial [Blastocatellia bacterium]
GAYTVFRGSRLLIWSARSVTNDGGESVRMNEGTAEHASGLGGEPGTVVSSDKSGLTVACGAGTLMQLIEVQIEGKRRVSARDFANGARLAVADPLSD